ncbi:MAG TPA: SET domain-containing protein-lysine N-methyltransferase [Dehalococcoidia bacterium]|jgi:SET domain-containing protein
MKQYRDTTWLNPKIEVRPSAIEGRGLFAKEDIHEGEPIVLMGGQVLTDEEFRSLKLTKYSAAAIGEGLHILLDTPNPAEYGNHSCDANTWMADEVTTAAKRRIRPLEEVTIDYAVFTATEDWSMPCNCNSARCRGVVTGNDWRIPEVQQRYAGHFSPFLNVRIELLGAV